MSEMSEKSRARAKDKLTRLMSKSPGKVDASGWTENSDQKGNVQTGMRVLSRRAYRAGGLVASGVAAAPRADRKPRAKGGGVIDDLVNVEMKKANGLRDGEKHIGGLKAGGKATAHKAGCSCAKCSGGKVARASGGRTSDWDYRDPQSSFEEAIKSGRLSHKESDPHYAGRYMYMGHNGEGKALFKHSTTREYLKAKGGEVDYSSAATPNLRKAYTAAAAAPRGSVGEKYKGKIAQELTKRPPFSRPYTDEERKRGYSNGGGIEKPEGLRAAGDRIPRASGGRTKRGAMNVNIIIAQTPKPALAAPQGAPLPPNAGPLGLHQGAPPPSAPAGAPAPMMPAPMMRKRGGRAYPIDTGGGGGKARLAKAAAYG